MAERLSIRHIVIFKEDDITFASCKDIDGKVRNFCIYNHKGPVKEYRSRNWQAIAPEFANQLRDRVETALTLCSVPVINARWRFAEQAA